MPDASAIDAPRESENEINLTPMLDVVFIMLIFFIVTASFLKESGIDVNRPDTPRATVDETGTILITINGNSEIMIDGRLIDPRAVRANVERLRAEKQEASVVIRADRRSLNDTLVRVMDASRQAGIYDIAVAE